MTEQGDKGTKIKPKMTSNRVSITALPYSQLVPLLRQTRSCRLSSSLRLMRRLRLLRLLRPWMRTLQRTLVHVSYFLLCKRRSQKAKIYSSKYGQIRHNKYSLTHLSPLPHNPSVLSSAKLLLLHSRGP